MSSNINCFYAQTRSDSKNNPVEAESDENALLTFADMVLALDTAHETCESDHTYAGYESEENVAQLLDAEILIQKEKDHPYAFSGRWKGRPPNSSRSNQQDSSVLFTSRQRSSSEENLFRPTGTVEREVKGSESFNTRKCHSFEKVFIHDTFRRTTGPSEGMVGQEFVQETLHGERAVCNVTLSTSDNQEILNIPLTNSLSTEDNTATISEKLAMDVDPPEKDHTYARAKSKSDKLNKPLIIKQLHMKEKKEGGHKTEMRKKENAESFVLISDHTYHGAKQTRSEKTVPAFSTEKCEKLQPSDHTYYTNPATKENQPAGPVSRQLSSFLFAARNDRTDHNYSTTV